MPRKREYAGTPIALELRDFLDGEDGVNTLYLGVFIQCFAVAEAVLFNYFVELAGVIRPDKARAVFGAVRVESMLANIRRLWQLSPPSPRFAPILSDALGQFKAILNIRNDLLHYGIEFTDNHEPITTNASRAFIEGKIRQHRVSTEVLLALSRDINNISKKIYFAHRAETETRFGSPLGQAGEQALAKILARPWHYTPQPIPRQKPPQARPVRRNAKKGRRSPPESSE